MAVTIISNSFKDGDYLSKDFILSADFGFGCAGANRSPHLKWSDAPSGTKSFAVTCYDPDAPTGSGFWHWLVVNIPANVNELAEGAGSAGGKLPTGALQTRTDFGAPGYGGPCPPAGDHPHRYLFTVFAVKADKLDVKVDTSAAVVGFNLHFNTLAEAKIMGSSRDENAGFISHASGVLTNCRPNRDIGRACHRHFLADALQPILQVDGLFHVAGGDRLLVGGALMGAAGQPSL